MPFVGSASVKKVNFEKKDSPAKTSFSEYLAEPKVKSPIMAGNVDDMLENM